MPSLCYGLPHHCNESSLENLNSVTMSHVNQGRSKMKIISSLPNHFSLRISTRECRNTSLLVFSSTYIIFLLPLKIQRGTRITVLLPPLLLLCTPPNQAGMYGLFRLKAYSRGFEGDVGSDFKEWVKQTKTDKLK